MTSLPHPAGRGRSNVLWSALDFAAMPVAMLVATPILIQNLGLDQFGVLVLINALIGFSAIFNFGFGDTALKFVSHHVNLGQRSYAAEIVRTIGILTLGAGTFIALLFAIAVPLASRIFKIEPLHYAQDALYVTALIMPFRLIESVYVATLRGCYRYDLAAYATATTKLANVAGYIVLAILGHDLPVLLIGTALAAAASALLLFTFSYNSLGPVFPAFSRRAFLEIRRFSSWSWLQGLAGLVYANIDRLMIPALLGPAALGIYGVCIQLAQAIHYGLSALSHSLFPRVSMLSAASSMEFEGSKVDLRELYLMASRTVTVPAVLASSVLAVFSFQILDFWVGRLIAEEGYWILALLAISFGWFSANSIVAYYTLNGMGKAKLQAGISVMAAALMMTTCLVFIPVYALVGAAVARFADVLLRIGVRMYIGTSVIGRIRKSVALDFLWLTAIAISCSYLLKNLLHWYVGDTISLVRPDVFVLLSVFILGMYWLLQRTGKHISREAAAT